MSDYVLDPGYDFYQFVNHAWLTNSNNQIPSDYSSWGGFTKLYDDGLTNQINIVKELGKELENDGENKCISLEQEKISSIWKASENRFKLWSEGKGDFNPIIDELNILENHFNTNEEGVRQIKQRLEKICALINIIKITSAKWEGSIHSILDKITELKHYTDHTKYPIKLNNKTIGQMLEIKNLKDNKPPFGMYS